MQNKSESSKIKVHFLLFILINFLSFGLANLITFKLFWKDGHAYPSLLLISIISTIFTYFISRQNLINATTQIPQLIWKIIEFAFLYTFFVLLYWFLINATHYINIHISGFLLIYFGLLILGNAVYIRYLRRNSNNLPTLNTLVIGSNNFTQQFIESISTNSWLGFKFIKNFSQNSFLENDLNQFINENDINVVFINWDEFAQNTQVEKLLRFIAEDRNIKFYVISEIFGTKLMPSSYFLAGNFPYINLFNFPLDNEFNATLKRLFDIIFSILFFVFIASWLFPIIFVIILLHSGLPVFFKQKRHGMDNQVFDCYKFRTMIQNKYSDSKITVRNDPRVTNFGRILRKTSLDELPQFWNVLRGDMSVVGPRPHMVNQNNHYNQIISKYNFRHYVKPGITGLAQVEGFRGEIIENKDMENRIQSDIYYIRNWSFGLDLRIIYRTAANMLRGDKNAI
ncbi:MAG: exopolysaccharide biosynthesis polyprenyl glycosylphosphotransferase [Flavobacteriaceae bacterium]|nr:exopolysaccharide biosynthesis polyprenyl glycosylphosphotransferase [Flavobacteriaceae bacterium]